MGVGGLQTFIKENKRYFADDVLLSNTALVIDAANLLCVIFNELNSKYYSPQYRSCVYGGDFVAYGETLRKFFRTLRKCDIIPVMVFDGSTGGKKANNDVVTKQNNLIHKGHESFQEAQDVVEYPTTRIHSTFLPQRLFNIGKSVVLELDIIIVYSPYEADAHIARIANEYNLPVLSNDSDFMIFNLQAGFVLFDSLEWKFPYIDKNGKESLRAVKYNLNKAEKTIKGFKRENMPLLSVLSGNDYVHDGTFDNIFREIWPHNYPRWATKNYSQRRIANILDCMLDKTIDENIGQLVASERDLKKRKSLECQIRKLLKNFEIPNEDDLLTELERVYPKSKTSKLATPRQEPAHYLKRLLQKDELTGVVLDLVFRNNHYGYSTLDDISQKSSTLPLFRPYCLALTLLRSGPYEGLSKQQRKDRIIQDSIEYWDRQDKTYTKFTLTPLISLPDFGSLDHLDCYSMILLKRTVKKDLIMSCFRFKGYDIMLMKEALCSIFDEPYLEDACVTFLLIKYIGQECGKSMDPSFVDAVLLTYLYYADYEGCIKEHSIEVEAYRRFVSFVEPHTTKNNKIKYPDRPDLYRPIMHLISQLHAALRGFTIVNTLLGKPLKVISQDSWFNGVLLFRLTKMIQTADPTMRSLCQGMQPVLEAAGYVTGLVRLEQ